MSNPDDRSSQSDSSNAFLRQALAWRASGEESRLQSTCYMTFSSAEKLVEAMAPSDPVLREAGLIDFPEVTHGVYEGLGEGVAESVVSATTTLLDHVKLGVQEFAGPTISCLLLILCNPSLKNPEYLAMIIPKLCFILVTLGLPARLHFIQVLTRSLDRLRKPGTERPRPTLPTTSSNRTPGRTAGEADEARVYFTQLLIPIQQFLTLRVVSLPEGSVDMSKDEAVIWTTRALQLLHQVNDDKDYVPFYEFYNEAVEKRLDLKEEYPVWRSKDGFSMCNFPFLLSTPVKADLLKIESMIQMRHELQDSFFRAMFIGVNMDIRRDHIVRDTLFQLSGKKATDLRKQLRISFVGEEGVDEGGVQKEFFQLIVKDMFNAAHGMFVTNPDSRMCWFAYNKDAFRDQGHLEEYTLIGRLLGLAMYNTSVLSVPFPLALYKKLLGTQLLLEDVKEYDPLLGKGLEELLWFEGDVEEVYGRTFAVDVVTALGEMETHELRPNGSNLPVTNENRHEFVDLYIDFLFNKSVEAEFRAFKEGFDTIMAGSTLHIFRPEELMEFISGSPHLDFHALQRNTRYEGFTPESLIIVQFWELVHDMTEEYQKRLLFFATGSDRVPAGGLAKLNFAIARNGPDTDRLPTTHTCYNILLLNEYSSKEKLRDRLYTALDNSNCGFFLI